MNPLPIVSPSLDRCCAIIAPALAAALCVIGFSASAEPRHPMQIAQVEPDASPQAEATQEIQQQPALPGATRGQLVVTFPLTTPDSVIDDVGRHYGMQVGGRIASKILNRHVILFRIDAQRDLGALLAALAADPRVGSVHANQRYEAVERPRPAARAARPHPVARVEKQHAADTRKQQPRAAKAAAARLQPRVAERGSVAEPAAASDALLRFPSADEPFVGPLASQR